MIGERTLLSSPYLVDGKIELEGFYSEMDL